VSGARVYRIPLTLFDWPAATQMHNASRGWVNIANTNDSRYHCRLKIVHQAERIGMNSQTPHWDAGAILTAFALLSACSGGSSLTPTAPSAGPSPTVAAGKALFSDINLSASGRQSCATCHVPARAFTGDPAADNGLPVPLGGVNMDQSGFRNAPSLMYAVFTPPFTMTDTNGPVGGFFRDGRASSLVSQAQQPFLTSFEMGNQDAAEVLARLRNSPATLQAFVAAFGESVLADPDSALQAIAFAIASYESEDDEFRPFSSKFDFWIAGQALLSAQEQRGMDLFNDPGKGNCAACHPSQSDNPSHNGLFTDFSFDNIGVPRNWAIPANAAGAVIPAALSTENVPSNSQYAYYDLGLCGPFTPLAGDRNARPNLSANISVCGAFKVPTLRNIAVTSPYFHNGVFSTLHQVVEWYVTRDINNNPLNNSSPVSAGPGGNPYQAVGTFYLAANGTPDLYQYNDLPVSFDSNLNVDEVPYAPASKGLSQVPSLSSNEIDDLVAFLCTLTDGYDPADPSAYNVPAQCAGPS
jgi:cytochrome c peroxidase